MIMVSILVHFQGLCFACLVYEIDSVFFAFNQYIKIKINVWGANTKVIEQVSVTERGSIWFVKLHH